MRSCENSLFDVAGEPGASQGIGAAVADFAFADVAREVADADFELRRPRPAGCAADPHAVGSGLLQGHAGKVGDDIRRDITERVRDLVEQLFLGIGNADAAAGALDFSHGRVARGIDIGVRKPQLRHAGHFLGTGFGKVTAAELAGTFQ